MTGTLRAAAAGLVRVVPLLTLFGVTVEHAVTWCSAPGAYAIAAGRVAVCWVLGEHAGEDRESLPLLRGSMFTSSRRSGRRA